MANCLIAEALEHREERGRVGATSSAPATEIPGIELNTDFPTIPATPDSSNGRRLHEEAVRSAPAIVDAATPEQRAALAKVGVDALIDEATGFQKVRPRHALKERLRKHTGGDAPHGGLSVQPDNARPLGVASVEGPRSSRGSGATETAQEAQQRKFIERHRK